MTTTTSCPSWCHDHTTSLDGDHTVIHHDQWIYRDDDWAVVLASDDHDTEPHILISGEEVAPDQAAAIGHALLDATQVVEQIRGGEFRQR